MNSAVLRSNCILRVAEYSMDFPALPTCQERAKARVIVYPWGSFSVDEIRTYDELKVRGSSTLAISQPPLAPSVKVLPMYPVCTPKAANTPCSRQRRVCMMGVALADAEA